MNEPDFSDFESELRALKPATPSDELAERIAAAMPKVQAALGADQTSQATWFERLIPGLGWAIGGAAAAFLLIGLVQMKSTVPTSQPAVAQSAASPDPNAENFEPAELTHELIAAEDEGLAYDEDQELVRRVRYTSIERHAWQDRQTGAQLVVEVPREDVLFFPVAMQ